MLGYLLYFTGGAANPFVTLLLVPIALSAAALSIAGVSLVAILTGVAYVLLVPYHLPLPTLGDKSLDFDLYVAGMGVNFVIMAILLGVFISNLAKAIRRSRVKSSACASARCATKASWPSPRRPPAPRTN